MKRTLSLFVLPLYVALMAAPALAGGRDRTNPRAGEDNDHTHDETDTHSHQNGRGHQGHGNGYGNGHHRDDADSDSDRDSDHDSDSNGHGVPELDKSVAGSAAVLLGGGVFVILGRRRKL